MGVTTKIAWCDKTFNPWAGCAKISTGCLNCYAEVMTERMGLDCFGRGKARHLYGDRHWQQPLAWNKTSGIRGTRPIVFTGSMCDVFDQEAPEDERQRLFDLIERTPNLFWLVLTKRPEFIKWPSIPKNVGLGVTVETLDHIGRISLMLEHAATLYFVSHEPALEAIMWPMRFVALGKQAWLITGGESGVKARHMDYDAAIFDRDQCRYYGVPFFFKQWSGRHPNVMPTLDGVVYNEMPELLRA